MLPSRLTPRRILMTTDAVGGVWRYSLDLAAALRQRGIETVLACLGPRPSLDQLDEVARLAGAELVMLDMPLDWMVADEAALDDLPARLAELAADRAVELLHLNAPSQACGLATRLPLVVASHSCVATWWQAMRQGPLPPEWRWQWRRHRVGMETADAVIVPSHAYGEVLRHAYGPVPRLQVIPNAVAGEPSADGMGDDSLRKSFVFAAARWWDESKNATVIDQAARTLRWPLLAAGACQNGDNQGFVFRNADALGHLSGAATRRLMREAAIFVSPSRFEPFGLAALEAAQSGAALVLADIPTYRELWQDAAVFFHPLSADFLAETVNALIDDDAWRADLAERGRRRSASFTPEHQCEPFLAAYRTASEHKAAADASPTPQLVH